MRAVAASDVAPSAAPEPEEIEARLGVVAPQALWLGGGWDAGEGRLLAEGLRPFSVRAVAGARRADLERLGFEPALVHVEAGERVSARALRRRFPRAALVLDARDSPGAGLRRTRRLARAADLVLESRESVDRPLDLGEHAPAAALRLTRDAELKRFRRFHRLKSPVVLYAGPYRPGGGLDRTIAAMQLVRETFPDACLAAIPQGPVDQRFLDGCERVVLAFGHRGIVAWSAPPDELPLWFALADVVCLPPDEDTGGRPAELAAAAARPVVATRVASLEERVEDGRTGRLVARGDTRGLADALLSLLSDPDEASRLGDEARRLAEARLDPARCAARLQAQWVDALTRAGR